MRDIIYKNKAIAFGNDHANTLGVIQALGLAGIEVIAVLWGSKTGIVASSRYTTKIVSAGDSEQCIQKIKKLHFECSPTVIIPCCDEAAIVLEKNSMELRPDYVFQHSDQCSLERLVSKEFQCKLAEDSGIDVPKTVEIRDIADIPEDVPMPCIIKPVVSIEGKTSDIIICRDRVELVKKIEDIIPRTKRILVQQYIEKDSDYGVVGCRYSDGVICVPDIIKRTDLYPPKTGLGTVYNLEILDDDRMVCGISKFLNSIDYIGLFSFEYAKSKYDGKYYFIEANFRNDGENPCLVKAGLNIHLTHFCDLLGIPYELTPIRPHTAISEVRHFRAMTHRTIGISQWIKDLIEMDSFMSYYKEDKRPCRKIISNIFLSKLNLLKRESY